MSRPFSKNSKHRREYVVVCSDPVLNINKYYVRTGYKSLILREFVKLFPDKNISIYVLSSSVISNIK